MYERYWTCNYALRAIAIGIAIAIVVFATAKAYCHVDMIEIRTPEWDRVEQEARDKECWEAVERINEGNEQPGDREKQWECFDRNGAHLIRNEDTQVLLTCRFADGRIFVQRVRISQISGIVGQLVAWYGFGIVEKLKISA